MLLVKDVTIIEVPNNPREIVHPPNESVFAYNRDAEVEAIKLHREVVRGQHFFNNNGEELIIGMCEQVQKTIGLPMKCFSVLEKENSELRERQHVLRNKLSSEKRCAKAFKSVIKESGFWKRFKYLFTRELEVIWETENL
ncbi:hypothetical protein CL634_07015 [bacterium]|nr:hypothetical protein [bacterium]|tara:strand:- start:62 stop:481 length:420 start_codon:yes stop_codon:yes gene_type:complete